MTKKVILSGNALQVAEARYFMEGENWETCTRRVAENVASIEKEKDLYTEKFHEMIYEMDFLPGGRILRNAGRSKGSMMNCFVLPIGDSVEEIGNYYSEALNIFSNGGGVGANFTSLRPKGDPILGKGGVSSGMVSFLKAADAIAKTIESGGQRRAAALACCEISHPEVIDFINAKLVDKELSQFNISVLVNEEFIKCVENDEMWSFKFNQKEYNKVKAKELWDLIISNMIKSGEPGLLNSTNLFKNNSYYFDNVVSTNPCWTGDTKVAVADGRGEVSFKQLVSEGKDIPVYCFDPNSKEVVIRIMRNPRLTSEKERILKITLDDGSIIRCTENHVLYNRNEEKVKAKDLKVNDRLHHMVKNYNLNLENKQEPVWITNGHVQKKGYCFEHRIQAEFLIGRKLLDGESVHHKDENNQNNTFENIVVMDHAEHTRIHQSGDRNVMRDKWWNGLSEGKKEEYRKKMSEATSGEKNGNWSGYRVEDLREIAIKLIKKLGRKISVKEWTTFCRENKYPLICCSGKFLETCYSENLNYKVLSIEEDGYEEVYNGTVDEFHNYYVYTESKNVSDRKNTNNYILSANCGESPLEAHGICDLGSLVLPNFITGNINTNWKKLESTIKTAVRFLDDVIDVNKYSIKEIEIKAHNSRRIGLGIMGLAEYLFAKKLRYGSKDAIDEIEKLMRFIRDVTYETLVSLSVEKGSFPKFEPVQYGNASFIRKLPAQLRMDIKNKGVRCVTGLTLPPTGTTALLLPCTGGIEPLLYSAYRRVDRVSERIYIHPLYKKFLLRGEEIPDWFVDMRDLTPKDHLETQAVCQKYVDGAISKTLNFPQDITSEQLSSYLLEYIRDLKGCAVYVEGSREGQVYNKLTKEEVFDIVIRETIGVSEDLLESDVSCNCPSSMTENDDSENSSCEIPKNN